MAGKVQLKFKIYKGNEFLREESLAQPVIKIGKLSSSHIRLDDESVSRMHAIIEVSSPDNISIIDLGSTQGTIVNSQKVNKAKLQSGDEIVLGDIRIEFSLSIEAPAPSAEKKPARAREKGKGRAGKAAVAAAPAAAPLAGRVAAAAPVSGVPFSASTGTPLGSESIDSITGARAVEIASMLGSSMVGVKHVMNPRGGKIKPITWAMFGLGGILIVLSFVGFFNGVNNAAYNKESRHHHVEVEKKPSYEWRPRRISLSYDWMAIGGAIGSLFCLTYGLIRFRNEKVHPYFRIGNAPNVDFPLSGLPVESFPLVAPLGDDFVLNFTAAMDGELTLDGHSTTLAALQAEGKAHRSSTISGAMEAIIPKDGRFRLTLGGGATTFIVSSVIEPRRQPVPLFTSLESAVLVFFLGSLLVHSAILALLWNVHRVNENLDFDDFGNENALSRVNTAAQEDPLNEEEEEEETEEDPGGTGTKMALDEGKMGKKDSTRATGQFAMKKNDENQQLAKSQALDAARSAGVLGVLNSEQGSVFASLTGTGDFSSGLDERDVMGGLLGNEVGEMQGGWGYGVSGSGPGGGGTGWGTVGLGNYGTIGHGKGTGSGYGSGSGRGSLRRRSSRPPQVKIGSASATGDLDKNIIRRYVRRKLPRITNCYEKELLVTSSLSGTVVTNFQISPQGRVLNATATGLGNKKVESCVAAAIKSIQFPKPKGAGLVNVRYPFTFRPAGG